MNIEDFIIPSKEAKYKKWQLGKRLSSDYWRSDIMLIWVSDYRGAGMGFKVQNFEPVRRELYSLSDSEIQLSICDLGCLVSGKIMADTQYILEEILLSCHQRGVIPIVVGGSNDLAYSMFSALNAYQKEVVYTQISNMIALWEDGGEINDRNYLSKIIDNYHFKIDKIHLLGYQRHYGRGAFLEVLRDMNFDALPLSEMMNGTSRAEPFFRRADLVTLNCDAVESFNSPFSVNPQVNGLNKREICAYMREIGLGERIKSVGIFNYNFEAKNPLNHQLLAQMIWYLLEGINIRKTHPLEKEFETYFVMFQGQTHTFHKDIFRNLWYFGHAEDPEQWLACSVEDFHNAKNGILNNRFLK